MATEAAPRYRVERGRTCVDITVRTVHQLFDGRDPAPFRERDLDEDAAEYILGAFQEIPAKADVRLVFWIAETGKPELPAATVAEAVRAHFTYEREKLDRRLRDHLRRGHLTLGVGLVVLVVFLSLAEWSLALPPSHFREIVREGLMITGWVAMWRPLEVLLYDWWPLVRQRRRCARVVAAEVEVKAGTPSEARPGPR